MGFAHHDRMKSRSVSATHGSTPRASHARPASGAACGISDC